MDKAISGNYKHFKGNKYTVFCKAVDQFGNEYVLYRQQYGNKSFWIRPYDMFFEKTIICNNDGTKKEVLRFTPPKKCTDSVAYIKELINLIKKQSIIIYHSENKSTYIIANISTDNGVVSIQPYSQFDNNGGFLSEYEILRRLGKACCLINNKLEIWDSTEPIQQSQILKIENYDIEKIKDFINPCSIDLMIADSGFLCTSRKLIDPESIEHVTKATELWKRVKTKKSKKEGSQYFYLGPGETVLTHLADRISLPLDCAGKIEIKSAYARLSLSITAGDFCNPGYNGFFPLEITNNGKHTIIIHAKQVMAQLMLIPLTGPVLVEYSKKATQKNNEGYDDGTPYTFWRERSIKKLRKDEGYEDLIELYKKLRQNINASNADDVNAYKNRFDDSFLAFCQNKINNRKYENKDDSFPNVQKLLFDYIQSEITKKRLYSIRWFNVSLTIISFVFSVINYFHQWNPDWVIPYHTWYLYVGLVLFIIYIFVEGKRPKAFCTFEKIDIEKILTEVEKKVQP